MSKLYQRLFLAICAVSLVVLLVNIFVTERISRSMAETVPDIEAIARSVVDAYQKGGPGAVEGLRGAQREDRFDLFLMRDGMPASRRPPPEPLRESMRELLGPRAVSRTLGMGEMVFGVPVQVDGEHDWHVVGFRPPGQAPRPALASLLAVQIGIVIFAVALLSWVLSRGLTTPLLAVQNAVRKLAGGELGARVGTHLSGRPDEIGQLARDVDQMAGEIQQLVSNRERLLHDVSHELRAPLARLRLALELARMEQQGSKHLDQADKEISRLDAMVDEVLTLARLEQSSGELRREPVEVARLLQECAELAQPEADTKQIRIAVSGDSSLTVSGDAELLSRALVNLLRNAVRYSPAGGTITFKARADGGNCEILVADQGPGAATQDLQALFQPFYRARNAGSGGYGLGLAIVAHTLTAHGGSVEARNGNSGGLEVRCRLPTAKP